MSDDDQRFAELAEYQARLLDLLHEESAPSADDIRMIAGRYQHALGDLDNTLIEVASTLTKTWGRLR